MKFSDDLLKHIKGIWMSITTRMAIYLLLLSIIPLLILGMISNYTANQVINKEIEQLTVLLMSEKNQHLEMIAEEIESLIANVSGVDDIKNAIKNPSAVKSGYDNLATQAKIGYILSNYKNIKGLISIDIFTTAGSHYHVGDTLDIKEIDNALLDALYSSAEASEASIYWAGIEDNVNLNSQTDKVITAVKLMKTIDEESYKEKTIGLVMVNYDVDTLYRIFNKNAVKGTGFMIVDEKDRIIYYDDFSRVGTVVNGDFLSKTQGPSGSFNWNINGKDSVVTYEKSNHTNWRLISFMSKSYITEKTQVITHATLGVLLLCFIVVGITAYVFSISFVIPVKNVTNQFAQIKHGSFDMKTRLPSSRKDEIGELNQGFNTFVDTLEEINNNQEALRMSKEAAESANRLKGEFLANVSHEIRTPMNAIMGYTTLLNDLVEGEKGKGYLNSIQRAGNTLMNLINDILDISKIEVDKIVLNLDQFHIRQLIEEIQSVFLWNAQAKGIDLVVNIDPEIPEVLMLDDMRMRQVLFNLIGNAVKFTDRGKVELSVRLKRRTESDKKIDLEIAISDTGIGIPSDQQDVIFEAFKQMDGQSTKRYGGTGLGLSISKRLVEIMGGTLTLESEPGTGSTFTVTLPDILVHLQTAEQQPEAPAEKAAPGRGISRESREQLLKMVDPENVTNVVDSKMMELLDELYRGMWETCSRGNRISDIKEFAERLGTVGEKFRVYSLVVYGNALMDSAKGYNAGKIRELLKAYPALLDKLRSENLDNGTVQSSEEVPW